MIELPALPCYLNGEYNTLPHAKISVMDRGFLFGDGVYEVVPVYQGTPFRFEHHMARLARSLAELRIPAPLTPSQWREVVAKLVQAHTTDSGHQLIYIQVTRGVAMRDHVMPEHITPTVFAMVNTMNTPHAVVRAQGVACVTAADFRWKKAHIKTTSLLGAVFARQISFDAGAVETVMFRDGFLSEAAASNVWVVQNGRLIGPLNDNLVLEGIRYGLFAELCDQIDIPFEIRQIREKEVWEADELLLSSATKEIIAITTLDGKAVGHASHAGQPGPVGQQLYAVYQAAKRSSAPVAA